jgi:hypothetical protein
MASSNQSVICYEDIYESLLALTSLTEEQKTRVLNITIEWTTAFEQAAPTKLTSNLRYLLEILTNNVAMVPLLPVETIFIVIQSADIPSEAWLDCLLVAVQSTSNTNQENLILFDFTSVIIPTTNSNSSALFNSLSGQELYQLKWDSSSVKILRQTFTNS